MRRYWLLMLTATVTLTACPEPPTGGNGNENGSDRIQWPAEALATIDGGSNPDVAVTASGEILLTLGLEGRSVVIVDPAGDATTIDLGPGYGGRIATALEGEEAVVVYHETGEKLLCAWLDDGELAAPAFETIDEREDWGRSRHVRGLSLYWTGIGPAAFMHSHLSQVTEYAPDGSVAFRQDPRADFILQRVPRPERGSARLPSLDMRLGTGSYHMIGHGESPTFFDLTDHAVSAGDEKMVLGVLSRAVYNAEYEEPSLHWVIGKNRPGSTGTWFDWYGPEDEGLTRLPTEEYPTWIGIHRLGSERGVVTWHEASGGAVFDVFMTTLTIDGEGRPVLGEDFVNVSQTYGNTDHSEHPIVRTAGDGRLWVSWRESTFGPRVALYNEDLDRIGVAAPAMELHQSDSAPFGAAVLPGGDLLIAAEVWPGEQPSEVRLWRIELPR